MGLIDAIKNRIEIEKEAKEQYYDQSGANAFTTLLNKGVRGEYLTYKMLTNLPGNHKSVANCYIPKEDGTTTEIDLIMIHETGIYVFESKNYSGYIFGSQNQKMWTQTLPSGNRVEKNHFLNPIIQNKLHTKYLKQYLGEEYPIYSYIIFSDRCRFKALDVNEDTVKVIHRNELSRILKKDIEECPSVINNTEITILFNELESLSCKSKEEKRQHVREINQAHIQKKISVEERICPLCGGKLVLRTARKGANAGNQFYGCSNYPKCKFTSKS